MLQLLLQFLLLHIVVYCAAIATIRYTLNIAIGCILKKCIATLI